MIKTSLIFKIDQFGTKALYYKVFVSTLTVLTSTIAVKCGMCLVKLNQNDFKNYKIGLLELY